MFIVLGESILALTQFQVMCGVHQHLFVDGIFTVQNGLLWTKKFGLYVR